MRALLASGERTKMGAHTISTTVRWKRQSLMLLNDLYQFTAAYTYFKAGIGERESVFNLFIRSNPFKGGFTIACGLGAAIDFLSEFSFDQTDLDFLTELRGNDERPLFEPSFIDYLSRLRFTGTLHAVPEGSAVFPHEPLVRVVAPLVQAQLLETPLLTLVNFPSLVATKYTRICLAAGQDPVIGFGLRRAQGIDGALTAERAAYVGGIEGTSNVLASQLFGIPVKGTFPHSLVMAFPSELEAFDSYARTLPANCVFLVDTYDTLTGVRHAIKVGKEAEAKGHKIIGIRLDSGDLAHLSIAARCILDESGCANWSIVASNDLDEYLIENLKSQGAAIGIWGVGTKGITAFDQPALGGVYKLGAMRGSTGEWDYKIKLSEQLAKISIPGILNVKRFSDAGGSFEADMIYCEELGAPPAPSMVSLSNYTRRTSLSGPSHAEDLLVKVFDSGRQVYSCPPLPDTRARVKDQLSRLPAGVKRFLNPHEFPVGLEDTLHAKKLEMINSKRANPG